MKFGILIETNEPEKAWNGVRFANASIKERHEIRDLCNLPTSRIPYFQE